MDGAPRVTGFVLSLTALGCDREPAGVMKAPERATTASATSAPTSAKREPVELVVIDRSACSRLGVNVDDVVAALKAAKLTLGEPRASTEDGTPATVIEVAGLHDPAALMTMRLGETGSIVVAQVARFEMRRR